MEERRDGESTSWYEFISDQKTSGINGIIRHSSKPCGKTWKMFEGEIYTMDKESF